MFFGRKLLIGLLAFGTVAGYAAGFASFAHCARGHHEARRAAFEARVADVCTRAAHRVYEGGEVDQDALGQPHAPRLEPRPHRHPRADLRWPSE